MTVSICGVTYNRKELVKQWYEALLLYFPPLGKLYIADNNSTDGTKEYLQSLPKNKSIIIVYHEKNIGKGKAMNKLFEMAAKEGPSYMVSTDSDIVVGEGWYNQLNTVFEMYKGKKNVGWVSPIYYDDNNPIPHCREEIFKIGKEHNKFIDTIGCAGGFFMFPLKMYREVGGYCIDNVYGGIDGSYLHICRKAGYRCGYTTLCSVRHLRGGSEYDEYEKWKRKIQKNLKKHGIFNYKVKKGFWDK